MLRRIGLDVRTLHPAFIDVKALDPFHGVVARASLQAGVVASGSFLVKDGATQAYFGAQSDTGQPAITLQPPTGPELDGTSPGVTPLRVRN